MSLFLFPLIPNLSLLPFVLSLSKDTSRREVHFDKLSANGFSYRKLLL
tara:strand:+ start:20071 stop:20214 length:144 start_codon:yes stop_codon:yes gene_type:complete